MVTLRCKESGYRVTGENLIKTDDHYIVEILGVTQMFRIDEWEVVKNETVGSIEGIGRKSEEEIRS